LVTGMEKSHLLFAAALTAITGLWYTDIAMPWQDSSNLGLLTAELGRRFNAMVMRDGVGYVCFTGTYSQQIAKIAAANSKWLFSIPVTNPPTVPWAWAGSLMGIASGKLNDDPARQLRGMVLPGIVGSRPADRRTDTEEELLLEAGGTTFHVTRTGAVVLQRVVSSYLINDAGVADPAYHDIMEIKVATRIRQDWHGYFALMYPSNKLTDDGSLAAQYDQTVVTPGRAKGSYAARMQLWGQLGWVEDTVNQARAATFVRDLTDRNRLNCRLPYTRVGNMMVLAVSLQFNV
jgi:phage tail sheath gpL-like